jgi:hypothetical protein
MVSCPMALEHYCSARTLTNFRQLAFSLSGQSSLDLGPDNYLIFFSTVIIVSLFVFYFS